MQNSKNSFPLKLATDFLGIIADIGGTNIRFALSEPGGVIFAERSLSCKQFAGPFEAARAYLEDVMPDKAPRFGAMDVAGLVNGDQIVLTNNHWRFSIESLRRKLGLQQLEFVNDFSANALAAPFLDETVKFQIGSGIALPDAPIAVLGPGTGLGVGIIVPWKDEWVPVSGEGGHVTMPALNAEEIAVIGLIQKRYGHVSAESLISGTGLVNIYKALCKIHGAKSRDLTPADLGLRANDGTCNMCKTTFDMFFAMFGTIAGNLALTAGSRGGVYIMGGIVPRYLDAIGKSQFRERFEAKGRFKDYLQNIPSWVITHPNPAFIGLSRMIDRMAQSYNIK